MPLNSVDGGWTIVVDGKELADSGYIFGNGPGPVGGFGILNPGESYEFGKGLPVGTYFPQPGEHTISWKSAHFQSSSVKITIEPFGSETPGH
jgi:hypothetical protein